MSITMVLRIGGLKSREESFKDIDPTIVLRLHSVISGIDIFKLKKKYNYEVKRIDAENGVMLLPEIFVTDICKLNANDFPNILKLWHRSIEVKINNWEEKEAQLKFDKIVNFCKHSPL